MPPDDREDVNLASTSGIGRKRRNKGVEKEDLGARTEPDSATEDTTDYSSSGVFIFFKFYFLIFRSIRKNIGIFTS